MKHSTFAKSALALSFGLCATGALASTVTPVSEDFQGGAFASGINGVTTNNLTWADPEGGSAVEGGKLVVDAADTPTSATIDSTVTNNINAAIAASDRTASFEAKVSFTPATGTPVISDNDNNLRFALYAKAGSGSTNLVVYTGSETVTATAIAANTETLVKVVFTEANRFNVSINNTLVAGGPFSFAKNGEISKVEFSGNGEVDDIAFSYDANYEDKDPVQVSGGSYEISETEANYLNDLVEAKGATAVENALKGVTGAELKDAVLLNQDVTKGNAASATLSVESVKRNGGKVVVTVSLTRNGTILGAIRGKIILKACATPNGQFDPVAEQYFEKSAGENSGISQTFTKEFDPVVGKTFFKAEVVPVPAE